MFTRYEAMNSGAKCRKWGGFGAVMGHCLSRKRSKDKRWITPGLKISSRHKNRLFRRWLNFGSPIDEKKYKNYRRLYKHIADETEKAYFKELFDTRSNSIKQLWKN